MSKGKLVRCREIGFDCNAVARGKSEDELLANVAEHAQKVHNINEVTDEMVKKVKSVIREVDSFRVIAKLKAKPGKESELKKLLQGLVEPTRNEPGCLSYELLENKENPKEFTFVEEWNDNDALNGHFETAHVKHVLTKLPDILEEDMDLRKYSII